jgi:hypothetical protein
MYKVQLTPRVLTKASTNKCLLHKPLFKLGTLCVDATDWVAFFISTFEKPLEASSLQMHFSRHTTGSAVMMSRILSGMNGSFSHAEHFVGRWSVHEGKVSAGRMKRPEFTVAPTPLLKLDSRSVFCPVIWSQTLRGQLADLSR